MKKQIVGLAIFGLIFTVFFQNCSRPVSFQESEPMDFASLSVSGLLINNGDIYTNNSIVSLTLDVGNAADMYVTNSPDCSTGGVWVPATEQLSWELNSLNSETAVFAKFRSTYQKESPCVSDAIIHDNIAPVIALQRAVPAKTNEASTSINFSTSDSGSGIEKIFCPASIAGCSNSVSSANTADGVKSFSFYVTDRAGNRSADLNVSYLVDRTPPTLLIAQQPPLKTSSQTATFIFSGNDLYSSVVTYKCQMNGGAYVSCPANHSISGLDEGQYSLNVVALDDLGNTSAPQNASWTISRKLPNVTITKSPAIYTNQKESVAFMGVDQFGADLVKFECQLNSEPWKECTSPVDLAGASLVQGVNSFKVRGTDAGGLVSGEEQRQWNYDTVLPVLGFVSKPAAFTNKPNEQAEISSSEAAELVFNLDGAPVSTLVPGSYSFSPSEAPHAISVVATDKAGNKSAPLNYSFVSDFTKPTLSFPGSSFPNLPSPTASSVLNFQVVAADTNTAPGNNLSTFYSLSDLANAASSTDNYILFVSPINLTSLKNGSHQIKFYAKDAAGNQSDTSVSSSFLVDLFPPLISFINQPPPTVRPNSTQIINYLVQDSDSGLASTKCKLTIDGNLIWEQDCVSANVYELAVNQEGTFVFTITATDVVGNVSPPKSVTFSAVEEFQGHSKTFTVKELNNNNVDILFVMDGSHTMRPEYTRIAEAFSSFISNLGSINYRIALTTTDNAWGGTLLTLGSRTFIDNTVSDGLALLQEGLQRKTNQSGDEVGLTAIQSFIDRTKVTTLPEYQFYRSDAVLATVIITDDDEAAHGGYQDASVFLSDLESKLPNKVYVNHSSIVLPNDQACLDTQGANYGVTYFEASRLSGGINVSICAADYGNQLKDFATSIIARISEQVLECSPIDENRDGVIDIKITYMSGGSELPSSSYSVLGNRVRFASPLTNLGDYKIDYFCVR